MSASSSLKIREDELLPEDAVATADAGAGTADLSQDIADILSSFSPQETPVADIKREQRRAPHYRVRWNAAIATDGQSLLHGFINDISTEGASIYLDQRLLQVKATLHIHIPPLSLTSESRTLSVTGSVIYVVHDSNQQLFRAAISFTRFQSKADKACLDERLAKHHQKIPELY